ncbi:MAG: hypothetical protein JSW52_10880 [Candidatus Coatesbacteria bacterium]|nr:MAG: hypothetical protein JSW52_10880 [Candidatus Coatesbacteria bacterium]
MDRRKEEAVRLVLEGKAAAQVAKLIKAREETVREWFSDPEFIARAKKELTNKCLLLIPDILARLAELIREGSDTASVQAIKVVVKLWENVKADGEDEKVIDSLIAIIDKVLGELDREQERQAFYKRAPGTPGDGAEETADEG